MDSTQRYECTECEYSEAKSDAPETARAFMSCPRCGGNLEVDIERPGA